MLIKFGELFKLPEIILYICNEINNKREKLSLYFDKSYANIDIIKLSLDKLIQEFIHDGWVLELLIVRRERLQKTNVFVATHLL